MVGSATAPMQNRSSANPNKKTSSVSTMAEKLMRLNRRPIKASPHGYSNRRAASCQKTPPIQPFVLPSPAVGVNRRRGGKGLIYIRIYLDRGARSRIQVFLSFCCDFSHFKVTYAARLKFSQISASSFLRLRNAMFGPQCAGLFLCIPFSCRTSHGFGRIR